MALSQFLSSLIRYILKESMVSSTTIYTRQSRRSQQLSSSLRPEILLHSIYTLHYTLPVAGLNPFCFQNSHNLSWHRFKKVLDTPERFWIILVWLDQADVHHIPKVLLWIDIWSLWSVFEYSDLIFKFEMIWALW